MRLLRRFYYLVRLRRVEADLNEEIEFHRAMRRGDLERTGLSREEAAAAGARAMGNATLAREDARGVWLAPWLEGLFQDLAYALRNLRRQPGFATLAVVTLAAGIGLNVSLFTVFEVAAFQPWAVTDPGRMVNVYAVPAHSPLGTSGVMGFSIPEARYLDAHSKAFSGIVAMQQEGVHFESDAGRPSNLMLVTGNYFRLLGVGMERGSGFLPEQDKDAPEPVAVLSYAVWRNRFGGDPEIVGRRIRLDGVAFTVTGVCSRDFGGTAHLRTDVWIPFAAWPILRPLDSGAQDRLKSPNWCCSNVAGRLAPGIGRAQARAELELVSRSYRSQQRSLEPNGIELTGTDLFSNPEAKGNVTAAFTLMFVGVALVLLLACANVGNLLLARAAARQREIATRLSLGAGRGRVVRQLMTESLALAVGAAALGVAMAYALPQYILSRAMDDPVNLRLRPDAGVLGFAIVVSLLSCLAFGLAPALHATRITIAHAMQQQDFRSRLRLRGALLSAQVAISVVLLVSAGLTVRSIQHARALDPGFPVESVTAVSFDLPVNAYDLASTQALIADLRQGLDSLDGLKSYGLARTAPFPNGHWFTSFHLPGEDNTREKIIEQQEVAADYFGVLGIPIVSGRALGSSDTGRQAIVVNHAFARRYFGSASPVGKVILANNRTCEIVGVAQDAHLMGLDTIDPLMFSPVSGRDMPELLLRGASPGTIEAVLAAARRLDPRIQTHAERLTVRLEKYLAPARTAAALASVLGLLALSLASVGMFGVFAYVVRQRTREIGLRMALGAQPRQIARLVFGASSRSVLVGLAFGLLLAAAASRLLQRRLFGLSAFDPLAYCGVCLILCAAALAATWVPARRAIHIDPLLALHHE